MVTTLFICLCLATNLHAKSFARSISASSMSTVLDSSLDATTSSPLFDVDEELAKIAASCLSTRHYEQLTGNIVDTIARILSDPLLRASVETIGLTELRAALHFEPVRPWQPRNNTGPSESELASAPTIEAYYNLIEPRSSMRSLDNHYLFEHNVPSAITYLDKRFPSIRTIFRRKFEEIRRSDPGVIDKKAIDRMIAEFLAIYGRVCKATSQMQLIDDKCWDDVD